MITQLSNKGRLFRNRAMKDIIIRYLQKEQNSFHYVNKKLYNNGNNYTLLYDDRFDHNQYDILECANFRVSNKLQGAYLYRRVRCDPRFIVTADRILMFVFSIGIVIFHLMSKDRFRRATSILNDPFTVLPPIKVRRVGP